VQIPLERRPTFTLRVSGVHAGLLVVAVARVPLRTVLGPGTHADPTEFVFAFLAGHVAVGKGGDR
jgi:hypothetical protein